MASASVDLVRLILAAQERGDWSSAEWAHPEIEAGIADGPAPSSSTGPAGMAKTWRDFLGAWENFRVLVDEYREIDAERILVLVHFSGRGKTSGLELEQVRAKGAHLFHICAGKVTRLVLYNDRDRAFTDLGLGPEGGSS